MVARGGIEPPTRGFSVHCRWIQGLIINRLKRLPAPTPASPMYNPGTPELSSSLSWHSSTYRFIATTLLFSRTSSTSATSFTTASTRISTSLFLASARRSSAVSSELASIPWCRSFQGRVGRALMFSRVWSAAEIVTHRLRVARCTRWGRNTRRWLHRNILVDFAILQIEGVIFDDRTCWVFR